MQESIAICCRSDAELRRAHSWAIESGCHSVLVPRSEWGSLARLRERVGDFAVCTDDPAHAQFASYARIASQELPPSSHLPDMARWRGPVATLLTSGSSGEPKLIPKHAAMITGEGRLLRAALPADIDGALFATTAPLEHMFGYTFAYWLPRLARATAHESRLLTPHALRQLGESSQRPLWVVTTPTHLRGFVELKLRLRNIAGVLCATSPLSTDLARGAAACFGVPITEIYGSTETGAMAIRTRDAEETDEPAWRALPGAAVVAVDGGARFSAPYFSASVTLSDRLEFSDGGFYIRGRDEDLIKVCGKRHSLAALNVILNEAPGVRDGAYFLPVDDAAGDARPSAFVVLEKGATAASVMQALRGRVDDIFLPRPLIDVAEIPRSDTGKIRRDALRQLYQASVVVRATAEASDV